MMALGCIAEGGSRHKINHLLLAHFSLSEKTPSEVVSVRDKEAEKTRTVSALVVDGIVVTDDDSVSDAQFARRDILRLSVRNNRSFLFTPSTLSFLH